MSAAQISLADCYFFIAKNATLLCAVGLLLTSGWLRGADDATSQTPHWITTAAEVKSAGTDSYFRRTFEVTRPVTSARLITAGEDAGLELYLDGKLLRELGPYAPIFKTDLTQHLVRGKHVLAVRASGGIDAQFFVRLQLKFADGTTQIIATNKEWQAAAEVSPKWNELEFDANRWEPAREVFAVDERLLIPDERRIDIAATDNYDQWRQASGAKAGSDPAKFSIAPDFQIELIRSAEPGEDSWISLVFDPQGRAIISQEQQGLLRMTLAKDGGSVERTERINENLKEVRGMAFLGKDLYVNANNAKGMFRLRGDERGELGNPELLFSTEGGVGHGRNDVAVGPDGKIYSIHGDSVHYLPQATNYTSPLRSAEQLPPQTDGQLLRFDPATNKIETLVAGLRNPYGVAFNRDGEAFTYDADAEHDMGSPWYRPTRVLHLTTGSDFGWRAVTGKWPPYYPDHPDNAPFNLDIGKGSPTAVSFGTQSNFPLRYRRALFILDWTYGRILAVHCLPRGGSYLCEAETFLKGRPLNVVDLDFAPDGSMYLTTGGRKTQSALYRVRYVGARLALEADNRPPTDQEHRAQKARELRRKLESQLATKELNPDGFAAIWKLLGDRDPWIRNAARSLIEHQPKEVLTARALEEQDRLTALVGLTVLTRIRDAALSPRILARLNELELKDAPRTERLLAAWIYYRCVVNSGELEPQLAEAVRQRLSTLYPDRDFAVNEQLSFALAQLGAEDFVDKTVGLLTAATEQAEQMHYLLLLRNTTTGWRPETRDAYFQALAETRNYVGGEGMPKFLQLIREESLATIADDIERTKYEALLAEDSAADVANPAPREVVRKWTVDEALAALKSVDGDANLARGRELFSAASCSRCHRLGKQGTFIGPDLTAVSNRFSRRDLLESIVEPSKSIADNYRSLQVLTVDGKTHLGRPALGGDYRSQVLRLNADPQRPLAVTEIDKREIEAEQLSPISFMPEGLLNTLTAAEIRDLLAFLAAGGRAP